MNHTPQSPKELLTLMASTQTQIDIFSDGVIEAVQGGEINPLTVLIQLKAMEKASERILKEIKPALLKEADLYPEKDFSFMGNKITKAELGTKYDFTNCGDNEWLAFNSARQSAMDGMKERETFLKSLKEPIDILDKTTGEVITVRPPTKTSSSGLTVSIR